MVSFDGVEGVSIPLRAASFACHASDSPQNFSIKLHRFYSSIGLADRANHDHMFVMLWFYLYLYQYSFEENSLSISNIRQDYVYYFIQYDVCKTT